MGFLEDCKASRLIGCFSSSGFGSEYSKRGIQMRRISFWSKSENPKMLKIEFWLSENLVKKWSKRPWDPHNRIRLEKLCPKVVSNPKMAGRMTSKRRFWDVRPIIENPALNVNFAHSGTPPCRRGQMRGSRRIRFLHQKIENPKMLRIEFWTSEIDVKKW